MLNCKYLLRLVSTKGMRDTNVCIFVTLTVRTELCLDRYSCYSGTLFLIPGHGLGTATLIVYTIHDSVVFLHSKE